MSKNDNNIRENSYDITAAAPKNYLTKGKDTQHVMVQERTVRRLKKHIDAIPSVGNKIDFFSIFIGASFSCLIPAIVEYCHNGKNAPTYTVLLIVFLVLSLISIFWNNKSDNAEQINYKIAQIKEDAEELMDQANIKV